MLSNLQKPSQAGVFDLSCSIFVSLILLIVTYKNW